MLAGFLCLLATADMAIHIDFQHIKNFGKFTTDLEKGQRYGHKKLYLITVMVTSFSMKLYSHYRLTKQFDIFLTRITSYSP